MTLKRLIRTVHASQPAEAVMGILGKRYPVDEAAFAKSGLPGVFNPARAGKRIKLPTPETWETQVSAQGNKAATWEGLIEHNKLPFMAALRNLRNLLKVGISDKHHDRIVGRLQSERAVAGSRQFPFRFLAAYDVLEDLSPGARGMEMVEQVAGVTGLPHDSCAQLLVNEKWDIETAMNHFFTFGPPGFIAPAILAEVEAGAVGPEVTKARMYGKVHRKPAVRRGASGGSSDGDSDAADEAAAAAPKISVAMVSRYRAALDTAVRLAIAHNVAPLPGYTAVFCDVSGSMRHVRSNTAKGLGRSNIHPYEISMLLGLLIHNVSERGELQVFSSRSHLHSVPHVRVNIPEASQGRVLENMAQMRKLSDELGGGNEMFYDWFDDLMARGVHVDRLVVLSDVMIDSLDQERTHARTIESTLAAYRSTVNKDFKFICIDLYGSGKSLTAVGEGADPRDILISGYSDRVLQFIACEPGAQVKAVERMDQRLPAAASAAAAAAAPPADEAE
jgi:telomerase protein component 1